MTSQLDSNQNIKTTFWKGYQRQLKNTRKAAHPLKKEGELHDTVQLASYRYR